MRLVVISDTHLKDKNIDRLKQFLDSIEDFDLIIHCGDLLSYKTYETIIASKKCVAVHGNNDDDRCKAELKEKVIINIQGYSIGIFHGHGNKGTTLQRVEKMFDEDAVDIILYGHSHKASIFTQKGILYMNPGSLFYKRKEKWCSYISLNVEENNLNAEIRFFKNC